MLTVKEKNAAVKSWLWRYREAKLNLQRLKGEYLELVSVQESVRAVRYDNTPAGGKPRDLSDYIADRSELALKLEKERERLTEVFNEISRGISHLNRPIERNILSLRYLQLKEDCSSYNIDEISRKLGYSQSVVKTAHGAALANMVPIINRLDPSMPIPIETQAKKKRRRQN